MSERVEAGLQVMMQVIEIETGLAISVSSNRSEIPAAFWEAVERLAHTAHCRECAMGGDHSDDEGEWLH